MIRKVQVVKTDLLRQIDKPGPEEDVELDLLEISCQAFERIRGWYGDEGLRRCLHFVYDRFHDEPRKADTL